VTTNACPLTGPLADAYRKPPCYASIAALSPPRLPSGRPFSRR
jgi:hypothetical protein